MMSIREDELIDDLQEEITTLQRQLEEKTRLLAAYEAQPVVGITTERHFDGSVHPIGTIAKPSSTAHLDALLAEAERKGMERAAEMARKSGATNLASKIEEATEAIRAAAQNLEQGK